MSNLDPAVTEIEQLKLEVHRLKELVAKLTGIIIVNHEHHKDYDEYDGYADSEMCEMNMRAIGGGDDTVPLDLGGDRFYRWYLDAMGIVLTEREEEDLETMRKGWEACYRMITDWIVD